MSDAKPELPEESWKKPLLKEPAAWFERFCKYRDLGPGRTVQKLWDEEKADKNGKKGAPRGNKPSGQWRRQIEKWRWEERILQYNTSQSVSHLQQFEDDFTKERINQHNILQRIQGIQLEALQASTDEEFSRIRLRIENLGEIAGLFKLGNTMYETMHGRPNDRNSLSDVPDPTEARGPMLIYLPEHTKMSRLERAQKANMADDEVTDV